MLLIFGFPDVPFSGADQRRFAWENRVLATCGIRPPDLAFKSTQSRFLLLADSPEEE